MTVNGNGLGEERGWNTGVTGLEKKKIKYKTVVHRIYANHNGLSVSDLTLYKSNIHLSAIVSPDKSRDT